MAKKPQKELTFEEALSSLESLVSEMENDQLPLEKLLLHYEEGNQLLLRCQNLLNAARQRVVLIRLNDTETKKPLANCQNEPEASHSDDESADDITFF